MQAWGGLNMSAADTSMSDFMSRAWSYMAIHSYPYYSDENPDNWPRYNQSGAFLRLNDALNKHALDFPYSGAPCTFWASVSCIPGLRRCRSD